MCSGAWVGICSTQAKCRPAAQQRAVVAAAATAVESGNWGSSRGRLGRGFSPRLTGCLSGWQRPAAARAVCAGVLGVVRHAASGDQLRRGLPCSPDGLPLWLRRLRRFRSRPAGQPWRVLPAGQCGNRALGATRLQPHAVACGWRCHARQPLCSCGCHRSPGDTVVGSGAGSVGRSSVRAWGVWKSSSLEGIVGRGGD